MVNLRYSRQIRPSRKEVAIAEEADVFLLTVSNLVQLSYLISRRRHFLTT
jgi:hypothetical protein